MSDHPKLAVLGQVSEIAREIEHPDGVSSSIYAAELAAAVCLVGHPHPSWASTRVDLLVICASTLNWILAGDRADQAAAQR